jgi:hypothetical protein
VYRKVEMGFSPEAEAEELYRQSQTVYGQAGGISLAQAEQEVIFAATDLKGTTPSSGSVNDMPYR